MSKDRSGSASLRLVASDRDTDAQLYRGIEADGPDAALLRAVIDSSPDCIKVIELDGTLSFMNANGCSAMEIDDFCPLKGEPWDLFWPRSVQGDVLDAVRTARDGRVARFEAYCPTAKGTPRWWDVSVAPVRGADGRVARMVSVSRDVTERVHRENRLRLQEIEMQQLAQDQARRLEAQSAELASKDLEMREVDHRMKNSLAMLSGLLKLEQRRTDDEAARATLRAAAARVATIASVHEQLYRDADDGLALGDYLDALVRDLVASLSTDGEIAVEVESDPIVLPGGQALTLGLAVVELVMNAIRHGDFSDTCAIEVACRRHGDTLRLSVGDNGCGLPDDFEPSLSKGLGMRVVRSGVAKLGGELSFANRSGGGAEFTICWPDGARP